MASSDKSTESDAADEKLISMFSKILVSEVFKRGSARFKSAECSEVSSGL